VPKHFQHACRFLRSDEKIAGYLQAIERNAQLLREIRSILPQPLDAHCLHASLEDGILLLLTDSPVWSSRLRFFTPELTHNLSAPHGAIADCRIRVQPSSASSATSVQSTKAKLTPKTARHLLDAASEIRDAQLAAALRRLASSGG
jgi:hypothetical protein